jgi:TPR repeat protein
MDPEATARALRELVGPPEGEQLLVRGERLWFGTGGERFDREAAKTMYRQAAELGNPVAAARVRFLSLDREALSDPDAEKEQVVLGQQLAYQVYCDVARRGMEEFRDVINCDVLFPQDGADDNDDRVDFTQSMKHYVDLERARMLSGAIRDPDVMRYDMCCDERFPFGAATLVAAIFRVGTSLSFAAGVSEDKTRGNEYYQLAVDRGHSMAMVNLGCAVSMGDGTVEDTEGANRLFRRAADLGNAYGFYNLGCSFSDGDAVKQDFKEAFRLFSLSAELGYAKAVHNLGYSYRFGEGVEVDLKEAIRLFRISAAEDVPESLYLLGEAYVEVCGLPKPFVLIEFAPNAADR